MRRFIATLLAASAVVLAADAMRDAHAQAYPAKPIRFIVPFPAGGATDVVARTVGQKLSENLGQPVIVDNRPGAGGNIGAEVVANAPADGYTLLVCSAAEVAINVSLYKKLPYDPVKDFAPVTLATSAPLVLVVHPSIPARSVQELIGLARSRPGQLVYASSGSGGPQHLAGELFKLMAKIDMVHVPYKGGAPAITDLVGGHVQLFFGGLPPALPHVRANKLRALAVTSAARTQIMPTTPTISESGIKGFAIDNWQGMMAPAKTPAEIVTRLNTELVKALRLPEIKQRLFDQGTEPVASSPQQFHAYIKSEIEKYADVIRKSGAKVD
jgi:tripartite-type tricarboxylate transporter receptor subunit TctC